MTSLRLGNNNEISIENNGHMYVVQKNDNGMVTGVVDLGLATPLRIENIQDALGRLYAHGVKEKAAA